MDRPLGGAVCRFKPERERAFQEPDPPLLADLPPPKGRKALHCDTRYGHTWTDDYQWLRAENRHEVFREPSVLRSGIRAHLEAENAYLEAMLGETKHLQAFLVGEMRSRIREDDASVPMSDGPWAYGTAFVAGGEHRRFIRVPAGGDEASVLLDGDREADGKAYFQISDVNHSPNHTHLIWDPNDNGSEYYALRVRDLATGSDLDDIVERTHGASVWSLGYEGFFYTCLDENHRSSQVWNHRPGTPAAQDRLVHEETDPGVFISLGRTRDDA